MESSDCDSESAKKSDTPYDYANTDQMMGMGTDVSLAPCGSCEGCNVTEDCGTTCENCVNNYIQTAIENSSNPNLLPCLKSICHAKKRIGAKMKNVIHKRESVIRHSNAIKQEQEFQPQQSYDSMSGISEMKPNINESLVLEEDKATTRDTEQTENESKIKSKGTDEIKDNNTSMEQGHSEIKKSMMLHETSSDDSLAISEDKNGASNMCGSCKGCTTDCGDCWACIQRDVVATNDLTSSTICQKKCHAVKEVSNREIEKENDKKVKIEKRKRCGTCDGCVVAQNCGNCAPCVRKERFKTEGKKFKSICNARKCHKLKTPAGKRCGDCEGCQSRSFGNCSFCIGGNQYLCLSKRCQNKIYGPGVKIKPIVSKSDETSSDDSLAISEDENGASNMCGSCKGCTTDCGDCWACIQRDVVATNDLTSSTICQKKKCHAVKEVSNREIKKENDKNVKRKRCGTCDGCVVAQNCGNCAPCVRKERFKTEGKKFKSICKARKCHKLKTRLTPAGKRCGKCEGCQSQSCGICSYCTVGNQNFCPLIRCQNKSYGPGVKIKPNVSKSDKKMKWKRPKVDDTLSIDQTTKHNMVENWLDENVQSEENPDKKDANLKIVKRIKKCGLCFSCQAKDCGDCGSCKINKNYGDSLVLGKVACSANRCETPVELAGDLDAMMLQDDSSNGAVCPVKIIDGVLYDFRCFFCKKLPRAGSVNRSELMRHYSTVHYAEKIKEDFDLCVVEGHCLLCDVKLKNLNKISHIGQKHNEVVSYLPPEAVALCPEVIQKEQMGRGHPKAPVVKKKKKSSAKVSDWPQLPDGFNPSSRDINWKGSSSGDSDVETEENCEVVDGWIIEHVVNSDEEPPLSEDQSPDYSGLGGRCSVCQREFDEVTAACLHLHEDHGIQGGSSYLMRDCENFIKSGFILVSKVQSEIVPTTNQDEAGENSLSSPDTGGSLDFEAKRYVVRKSTGKKSRS